MKYKSVDLVPDFIITMTQKFGQDQQDEQDNVDLKSSKSKRLFIYHNLAEVVMMKYKDLTERIIGCAYRVHNKMGFGFLESVYEKCLLIALNYNVLINRMS